jgi:hypothetical protein
MDGRQDRSLFLLREGILIQTNSIGTKLELNLHYKFRQLDSVGTYNWMKCLAWQDKLKDWDDKALSIWVIDKNSSRGHWLR